MKYGTLIVYGIAILSIVLGFIALLKQKTYVDNSGKEITSVSIPLFGKLKTNYPSLLFLFLGMFLAWFTFNKSSKLKKVWEVSGTFVDTSRTIQNWSDGELSIKPSAIIQKTIDNNGNFSIMLEADEGYELEDVLELISFTHPNGSASVVPKEEKLKKQAGDQSCLLSKKLPSLRIYKPVTLSSFQ